MSEEKKGECWKPALKIIKVLQCIQVLIGDPNLEDPLDEDINEVLTLKILGDLKNRSLEE